MANNAINYNRQLSMGQLTAEMADHIEQARALSKRIQEKLVQLGALAGPGSGVVVEGGTLFGVEAGKGDAFVTAIGYMYDGLRGAAPLAQDQLANIDLGG